MSKKLLFILMASLALAACQNDKTPTVRAPAEPAAVAASTDVTVAETKKTPIQTKQKQIHAALGNAVAVTKPAKSNTGQSMQAALHQAGAEVKANAEAMTAKQTVVEKHAVIKPQTSKPMVSKKAVTEQAAKAPVAKAKETVTSKVAKAVAKVAPEKRPALVAHVAPKLAPKAVVSSPPVIPATPVATLGNAARGKSLARKCKACHNFTAKKKVGPGLQGVFGRKAGIMAGMRYSPALAAGGWVWNEKNLALWVCDSKKAIKSLSGNVSAKTKMGVQHFCDAGKQADLIAFLKTL